LELFIGIEHEALRRIIN
jgi:hypothetical protein